MQNRSFGGFRVFIKYDLKVVKINRGLVFIIFGLLFIAQILKAQNWREIKRLNPAQTIQKIRFLNTELGYCVSSLYNGSTYNINRSTNGGLTWEPQNSGYAGTRFMDIFILNEQKTWICGNDGIILHTEDGGKVWKNQASGTKEQLWGIFFTDEMQGHACGANGLLLRTQDGGKTWEQRPSGINNLFYSIFFIDQDKGFASGSNVLMRTDDAGENWYKVVGFPFSPPADWIRRIQFVNSDVGYACADIGRIYKTIDGGDHWERLESGTQEALLDLDFYDPENGLCVGFNGSILQTRDGGKKWNSMNNTLNGEHVYSVDMAGPNLGFVATHQGKILINDQLATSLNETAFQNDLIMYQRGKTIVIESQNLPISGMPFEWVNLQGAVLYPQINTANSHQIEFDFEGRPSGIYGMKTFLQNQIINQTLIYFDHD